jgi:hypothetical protein
VAHDEKEMASRGRKAREGSSKIGTLAVDAMNSIDDAMNSMHEEVDDYQEG